MPPPPSRAQLRAVMIQAGLPMAGFGFMDQTIMIHAGNAIDCTIGVTLGLSTLAAAAVGQIVANAGGIVFGETLQRFFARCAWIPTNANLTASQCSMKAVERARFVGTFLGILVGCVVGLANLLFIDTDWTREQKLIQHPSTSTVPEQKFPFQIHVSNNHSLSDKHQPATTLTIWGPDVDGILATILTALKEEGYSVLEMSARPKQQPETNRDNSPAKDKETNAARYYEDIFVVRRRGEAIPEEELTLLTQKLLQEKLLPQNSQHPKHA
ncbi:Transmembrane protein 65 [Seminavis robusta]|uniref:Transmembrane protein 65 n=1 Tax=Seminavis robusta TaxID=568900 RepID=A0A9N8DWH4_9STRA|nr:Transmembrane protein 65 [Seminavis robusta]|eukprot:Sro417_g138650.1 Transmembrane protein 65 (269) ;mRNA; r:15572-16378